MNIIKNQFKESLAIAIISLFLLVPGFAYVEPNVLGAITDEHTVTQTVTAEITFADTADDVVMSPSLGGITGGTADGLTQFRIVSNNSTGFNVTIESASNNGMEGDTTNGVIPFLDESTPYTPDYAFTTAPANSAAFAYTINASTTGQIVQAFRNNGSDTCGTGATETDDNCWIGATTTARTIINTTAVTASSGATSTLKYRAIISADPEPLIPEDTYTSTITLTAVNN